MTVRHLVPLLLACGLAYGMVACSSSTPTASPSSAIGGDVLLAPPAAGQGVQYQMQTTLAAGQEDERCSFVLTTEDLWVSSETVRYTPGSHHFLVWQTPYTSIPTSDNNGNVVDTSGVFECPGGPQAAWDVERPVGGSQSADAPPLLGGLPSNVALHIPAGVVLALDFHIINASPNAVSPEVRINLNTVPMSQVTTEAGIYLFYNPFIRVPANGAAKARMSCPVSSAVNVVTMQTHMHARGLGGTATLEDSSGNVIEPMYASQTWTNPPLTQWTAPPKALTVGEQIDYECNYQSTQDTDVMQGLTTKDEMCVLLGSYYPRDDKFSFCSLTGNSNDLSSAATYIGTGTATCAATVTCAEAAQPISVDQGDSLYGCMVDSCPGAAKPLTAAFDCAAHAGASAGTACMTQFAACEQASCD